MNADSAPSASDRNPVQGSPTSPPAAAGGRTPKTVGQSVFSYFSSRPNPKIQRSATAPVPRGRFQNRKKKREKEQDDDGSISSKSSYHSAGQSSAFESLAMAPSDDGNNSSRGGEGNGKGKGDDEDMRLRIAGERHGRLLEAPEGNGDHEDVESGENNLPKESSRTKKEQSDAAAMTYSNNDNQQKHPTMKSISILMDGFSSVRRVSVRNDESPTWRGPTQVPRWRLPSSRRGMFLEDDDELGASRQSFNTVLTLTNMDRMTLSPCMKAVLGLILTVSLVVPFSFALHTSEKNKHLHNSTNTNTSVIHNATELPLEEPPSRRGGRASALPTPALLNSRLQSVLPNHTLRASTQPNTPQFQAYHWLLGDPRLEDYDDWEIEQRMAMATFFHAFGGPQWDLPERNATPHWLDYNSSECDWGGPSPQTDHRIKNCHFNGTIARLGKDDWKGFRGSMPAEIGLLRRLEEIDFGNLESFHRPLADLLSPNLQELTALKSFACSNCLFHEGDANGSIIPTFIGEYLPHLEHLDLSSSQLTGPIPSELGLLTLLTSLYLNDNNLQSAIPSELGMLSRLNTLWLMRNNLEGKMPTHLWGQWTMMKDLDLSGNNLTGSIPTTIGAMSLIRHWDMGGGNRFTGSLPSEVGLLSYLSSLDLGGNLIGGSLPVELQSLNGIRDLGLSGNLFTGTIPWDLVIASLAQVSQLSMGRNNFTGTLPPTAIRFLAHHSKLQTLDIGNNRLDGTIPSEIGVLTALTSLSLNANDFQGELPSELSQLIGLQTFDVAGNRALTPEVSRAICNVTGFNFDHFHFGWCQGKTECCGY